MARQFYSRRLWPSLRIFPARPPYRQRRLFRFRHSGERRNPGFHCFRRRVTIADYWGRALNQPAGTRPGRRGTFLLHDKKVPKETCPAAPALRAEGSPESRPFARRKARRAGR